MLHLLCGSLTLLTSQQPPQRFSVPREIGAPAFLEHAELERQPLNKPRTLADAAAVADRARRTRRTEASDRPFNLDFVPVVGWRGTVFPSVLSPVLCSVAASGLALVLHNYMGFDGIDKTAHTVGGVLVSFLAVFRTQQAYARYWEGRGHLGTVMAGIIEVASMASVQLSGERPLAAAAARMELARLLRLYFVETVGFLRRTSLTTQRVSNYWLPDSVLEVRTDLACSADATEAECIALRSVPRPPVLVLQWIRAHLYRVGVEGRLIAGEADADRSRGLALGIDRVLSTLQPAFNGCAKIATTPAPQPYTQMGRWLVFFFVYTSPLALIGTFGGLGAVGSDVSPAFIPAGMLLAFGYYGLDYCANQLQNPFIAEFGDVQLDGRFMQAVCEDVDMLLCKVPEQIEQADAAP